MLVRNFLLIQSSIIKLVYKDVSKKSDIVGFCNLDILGSVQSNNVHLNWYAVYSLQSNLQVSSVTV